jgi:hypothetical protein
MQIQQLRLKKIDLNGNYSEFENLKKDFMIAYEEYDNLCTDYIHPVTKESHNDCSDDYAVFRENLELSDGDMLEDLRVMLPQIKEEVELLTVN